MDFSLIVGGCSFANFLCGFCPEVSEDEDQRSRRLRCFKIFLGMISFVVDYMDFFLDVRLAGTLIEERQNGIAWGLWMGTSAVLGFVLYLTSVKVAVNSIRPKETNVAIQLSMSCAVEIALFLIEDTTTVMAFTREDGAFDPGSLGDVLNVFTTTISAAIVFVGTIPLTMRMWNSAFGRKRIIVFMIGPIVAVVFFTHLLIGKVYMGVPLGRTLRIISFILYVPFFVMGFVWVYLVHYVFPFMVRERVSPLFWQRDKCQGFGTVCPISPTHNSYTLSSLSRDMIHCVARMST